MAKSLMIRARPQLMPAVALLKAEGLPTDGLTDDHLEHFFCVGPDRSPVGLVGLEIHGADALLRSLVVGESERGRGLASRLVERAEDYAVSKGVRAIYLLTMTAESFFARRGYERIERTKAPPSIQRTREFASLCPASSAFMTKIL